MLFLLRTWWAEYVNVDGIEERRELESCAIGKKFKRIGLEIGREESFRAALSCGGFRVYSDEKLSYFRNGHDFLDLHVSRPTRFVADGREAEMRDHLCAARLISDFVTCVSVTLVRRFVLLKMACEMTDTNQVYRQLRGVNCESPLGTFGDFMLQIMQREAWSAKHEARSIQPEA
jgi:hypothetical protein